MTSATIKLTDPINSWQDVANRMNHQLKGGETDGYKDWWLFRGVTNSAQHSPIPSIGRTNARRGFTYSLADEKSLIRAFKTEARPYIGYEPKWDLEWLTIAQHHGVPTRLLDWTESFLVALYFAVKNGGLQEIVTADGARKFVEVNAAIYYTKNPPLCSEEDEQYPFDLRSVRAYVPPHISPQIPAQRSVFTIHESPISIPSLKIKKSIISAKACAKIKVILDNQGINHGSLFPTLNGLSEQLRWRYKWNKLHAYRERR